MITRPIPFPEALAFLLYKEQLPAEWDAAMWAEQDPDFRIRAFWMAKQENARFVDRAQGLIFDYLAEVSDVVVTPEGEKTTVLRVGDRSKFIALMRDFMVTEGMIAPDRDLSMVNQKDVTDIRSMARLKLIFDTNVRQAYGYGHWKQGMTPAVRAAFPAARLIRDMGVKEPRPRHQANLGEVRLKTDPRWAKFHNDPLIGGFGVPWGPYGFNSGVTQEDVSRAKADALKLPVPPVPDPVPDHRLTDGLQASVKRLDPALKAKLLAELRGGPKPRDPREAAREAAAEVRREMLQRGLTEAVTRGNAARAEKYRAAIANLPQIVGLNVIEEAGKIVLENAAKQDMVALLPHDYKGTPTGKDPVLPQPSGDRDLFDAANEFRRILSADGEIAGETNYLDRSEQIRLIEDEARRLGFLYEGLEPEVEGGREHDLIFDASTGTVLKLTKPSSAGYIVEFMDGKPRLTNGDPLEYLDRLILHDSIFGKMTKFIGMGGIPNNRRIITRQTRFVGRPARWDEIVKLMVDGLGFSKLRQNYGIGYEDSYAFVGPESAVFDMRPANVYMTEEGVLVSFDSIPVRLSDETRHMLIP